MVAKKLKWPETKTVGFEAADRPGKFLNPLLTPPPRSPKTAEDFRFPQRLGHWNAKGWDYADQRADYYMHHEDLVLFWVFGSVLFTMWLYSPDLKNREWARREAFLRTYKREALGLPLIERDVVPPERIVLPTEEELQDYPVSM